MLCVVRLRQFDRFRHVEKHNAEMYDHKQTMVAVPEDSLIVPETAFGRICSTASLPKERLSTCQ